jgi:hypothetical protein
MGAAKIPAPSKNRTKKVRPIFSTFPKISCSIALIKTNNEIEPKITFPIFVWIKSSANKRIKMKTQKKHKSNEGLVLAGFRD